MCVCVCVLFVVHTPSNGWRLGLAGQCCKDKEAFGMEADFGQSGGRVALSTVLLTVRMCAVTGRCCTFLRRIAGRACFWPECSCVRVLVC